MALPDMPLLFYFNALIVKILLFLFPSADSNELIIIVSKVIDTIGLPIAVYPLYRIQKELFAVAGFAVLSYSPVYLTSDAQKNTVALAFMTAFIYFFLKFFEMYELRKE